MIKVRKRKPGELETKEVLKEVVSEVVMTIDEEAVAIHIVEEVIWGLPTIPRVTLRMRA